MSIFLLEGEGTAHYVWLICWRKSSRLKLMKGIGQFNLKYSLITIKIQKFLQFILSVTLVNDDYFFNFIGQWRCNFSKNHYLILEFLEFVYSCKERRMPHSVEYFGRPCAKKVQIILIFWHAKIDKNICERIHGKKRLKKFWLVGFFFCFFL